MVTKKRKKLAHIFIVVYCILGVVFKTNAQLGSKEIEAHREVTYELVKQNNFDSIEVKYIGEQNIPTLNIWETLYFHLMKGEFNHFFVKINEYTSNLSYDPGGHQIRYMDGHFTDYREYIFDFHTNDDLWREVKNQISIHPSELFSKVSVSELDLDEQDFIEVFLYYMVWYFHRGDDQVDKVLDAIAQSFVQKYANHEKTDFIKKFILPRVTQAKFRLIMDIGTDYTIFNGSLNQYINPNPGFTFSSKMLLGYQNVFIGYGISVLGAKVNKDFEYQSTWVKDSTFNISHYDLIAGYSKRVHKNVSISPFVGYRFSSFRHRDYSNVTSSDDYSLINLTSNSPLVGCYFDIEFLHTYWKSLNQKIDRDSYSSRHHAIRLGFQYVFSDLARNSPVLEGNMMLFSIKFMMEYRMGGKRRALR